MTKAMNDSNAFRQTETGQLIFVVKNSGSDISSAFSWRISGAALA
jgi:hypothetical protein